MTEGNSLKLILQFMFPLLIGNIFQQTYNMVDSAIVGRTLGADALAAVGASSSVQFLILGFCIGICAGFAIPIAQQFGAGNFGLMRRYIFHTAVLAVVFCAMITIICSILTGQILHLMQTPDDIFEGAWQYLLVIFLGIPFTMLYNYCSSILRAVGDSKTPFYFLAFSSALNIGLDFFCILVLGWGVAGAAIATIFSQGLSGILCLIVIIRKFPILHLEKEDRSPDKNLFASSIIMGVPMGLQFSITAIGSMVMQSANNSLGSVYVSGFTAGMKIKQFALSPFDALGNAVSTFASQNFGAGRMDRVRKGIRQGITAGLIYGFSAGLLMILFGRTFSALFVSSEYAEVLDAAGRYVRCLGYFLFLLGILNICRPTLQGLGYSGRATVSGACEMAARSLVSFMFVPAAGYTAICFADQTAWASATVYSVLMLRHCLKLCDEKVIHA